MTLSKKILAIGYFGIAGCWLTLLGYVVLTNVVLRETRLGIIASHIDKLPASVANVLFLVAWCLFLFGWLVSIVLGFKATSNNGPL